MEIVLARHGKPDLPALRPFAWATPRDMGVWMRAYNDADVRAQDVPSATLTRAETSAVVIASPSRRCVQSAQALCRQRSFLTDALFREADPPYWDARFPTLPLVVWAGIFRLGWLCGFSAHVESRRSAFVRARAAAAALIDLAQRHGSVFLVSHGMVSLFIARHLLALGWSGPRWPLIQYWQYAAYRRLAGG